jgi:hypothetical protein
VRVLVLVTVAAALVACSSGSAATGAAPTSLTITYWANGTEGAAQKWTLRCGPARGTLPRPAIACRRLADASTKLFAEVPYAAVCTTIYGGPQVARVVGTLKGQRVSTAFNRQNGCEIARWNRLSPWLLPRGGSTS